MIHGDLIVNLRRKQHQPVQLRRYPETIRWALENENRMCLSGFMTAEYDDLPEVVKKAGIGYDSKKLIDSVRGQVGVH